MKAEGLDEDGEKEAKLRRNLNGKIYLCGRGLDFASDTCMVRHPYLCLNH